MPDTIRGFLQRFGQENDILVRWKRKTDPEETHPESITISWCDEAGQWWESDVDGHEGRPGGEHLLRAFEAAAKEADTD